MCVAVSDENNKHIIWRHKNKGESVSIVLNFFYSEEKSKDRRLQERAA
jgi:hypothetical protein